MTNLELAATFRSVQPGGLPGLSDEQLGSALAGLVSVASARWPAVALPREDFVRFVAARASTPEALTPERAPDLWIAGACARGDAAAIAAFEAAFLGDLRTTLARLRLDAETFDEARQKIRRELFVGGPNGRPKIAEYAGRGDLRGWLRVMALRSALRLARGRRSDDLREDDEQLLDTLRSNDDGPELAYVKELYRPALVEAFQEALVSLSAREQNLLRQHFVDELTVDQLGALYGVHRATAARWTASAREALVKATRQNFIRRVRVSRRECDSIMRLLQSQLGFTIKRRLVEVGGA